MALVENNSQLRYIVQQGTLTLSGTGVVIVLCPEIKRTSVVALSLNTVGSTTNVGQPWVSALVVSTSFSVRGITASANDVINYVVYNQ